MVFDIGEKVLIVEKRYFVEDVHRHFIGQIVKCSENVIRVVGCAWVYDGVNWFQRKPEQIERVIPIEDRYTIIVIPADVDIDEIKYVLDASKGQASIIMTDGKNFSLDVTEFALRRPI